MEEKRKAVALNYDNNDNSSAPKILVKADGRLADFLINKAKDKNITVIEDEHLASLLYDLPEGIEIPESLYKAVADIYVFLYKTHKKFRTG